MSNANAAHSTYVDVLQKNVSGSVTYTALYVGLKALHYQEEAKEQSGLLGEMSTEILDVFMFEQSPLPEITEEHTIKHNELDHNVIRVISVPFRRGRLVVKTRRAR